MPLLQPSDEKIIADDKRRLRVQIETLAILFGSFLALFAMGGGLLLVERAHVMPAWLVDSAMTALMVLAVVIVFTAFDKNYVAMAEDPDFSFDEDYLRKTIDTQHLRWRIQIAFMLFNLLLLAGTLTTQILNGSRLGWANAAFAGMFLLIALGTWATIVLGPGFILPSHRRALRDELTRAQQASAAQLGFFLAILAMGSVLVAAVYQPLWAMAALPGALAAVIALPGIHFLILQWRSSRDG